MAEFGSLLFLYLQNSQGQLWKNLFTYTEQKIAQEIAFARKKLFSQQLKMKEIWNPLHLW